MDKLINVMMDTWLEEYLQDPYIDKESFLMINNVLLPTEISTENLNVSFEYSFDGEKLKLDFAVEDLGLSPPTTEAFLTILDKAFTGVSLPGFSLVLEGGSDEEGFVEIEVPPTTSEPVIEFPWKVVWIVDNLTNLNLVSFKVREWPTPPPLPPYLDNLNVTPAVIELGDSVTISFDIRNLDSQHITYGVDIYIENVNVTRIWAELGAYEFKTVSHIITPDAVGDFNVTVHRMTGSFVVIPPPKPAEFEFSDLRIFYPGVIPPEVKKGETVTVTISIEAKNVGELMGNHTVEFEVDGHVIDSQEVTLEGGASVTVLFELTRGEETYEVEVEGFTESFTVVIPEPPFWNRPEFAMAVIGIAIAVAVAGYILMKRR
jgi:hypothetical protein